MKVLVKLILNAIAVFIAAYLLDGVVVDTYATALIVAVVLGVLNAFVRPILVILTLPITILTLGLFVFVLNVLLVLLAEQIVPGFSFLSVWWGVGFTILLSVITWFFDLVTHD